ncbi:CLOCK-interacting pacemaker [Nematolebias whitei]|uniref:CLOCK-interacting pacemaker n=1 Tax=Nematolebias whitei TaxID=451745 RepID=UPI0018976EA0|nr:CLOCK-interacting pacemaker [Nematolebias whitei]
MEMSTKRKADSHLRGPNQPRITKCGGSQADSERDSGFSDASSEHMSIMETTDSEDSPRSAVQRGSGPRPSRVAVVGGSYSGLSPMIIMNNVLLKQPADNPPALKPWGFSPTVEVVQPVVPQPQVVFLQPVVSCQASSASKEAGSKHRRSKKYLPILKSYPKIAPHPGDGSSSSGRGTASSSSSSSESERCSALTSNLWEHCNREKTQRLSGSSNNSESASPALPGARGVVSPLPQSRLSLPAAESSSSSPVRERPSSNTNLAEFTTSLFFTGSKTLALPVPQAGTPELLSPQECNDDGDSDSKRKRFCNTYNILSKSGLLDITLRTKELLRQNQSTQNDLDRLRKHTDLFLQVLQTGDTSLCVKLQASLQEEDKEGERAPPSSIKADQTSGRP